MSVDIKNGPQCRMCEGSGRMEIGNCLLSDPPQPMEEQDCPMCAGTGHYRGRITAIVEAIRGMAGKDPDLKVSWMKSFIAEGEDHKQIAIEVWHEVMGDGIPCLLTLKPKKKVTRSRKPPTGEPTTGPGGGQYRG